MTSLTVVTLNILDDLLHWERRAPLILAVLDEIRPDVVTLQEVSLPTSSVGLDGAQSSAHWLAERLGGYEVLLARGIEHPASDSLAVLTRQEVLDYEVLTFQAQGRLAQRVSLGRDDERWHLVNTHLYWNPVNEAPRVQQAAELLRWIPEDAPAVVCGDFNAAPSSKTLQTFAQRFSSAHRLRHGAEPLLTYPTMLRRGPGVRHWSRHAVLEANGLVRLRRKMRYGGTVDYVLVDAGIEVCDCRVVFDKPSPEDRLIYPSDHLGLYARLAQADR